MKPLRIILGLVGIAVLGVVIFVATDEHFRKMELSRFPSRAAWQRPEKLMDTLGIEAGDQIADLGAGDGYFVDYLSAALGPGGTLYAIDVSADAVAKLSAKVEAEGLENVRVVEGSTTDPRLPDGEIDLVFLCNVYHHIDDQIAYFRSLAADLAPDGRVAIVEARPEGWGSWASGDGHSTARDELVGEMEQAGYRLEESHDFLPIQHVLIFGR